MTVPEVSGTLVVIAQKRISQCLEVIVSKSLSLADATAGQLMPLQPLLH